MPIHDPLPICIDCHKRMLCIRNGVIVRQDYEAGEPASFQHADMYECQNCHKRHISGFSAGSIDKTRLDSFNQELENWHKQPEEFRIWWK